MKALPDVKYALALAEIAGKRSSTGGNAMSIEEIGERLEELLYAEKLTNYYRSDDLWHLHLDSGEKLACDDKQILVYLAAVADEKAQTVFWSDIADVSDRIR